METTVFTPAQQHLLRLMSYVKDEKTLSEMEDVLKDYFARKAENAMNELIEQGVITPDVIESWGEEHMRTPYILPNK